MQTGPVDHAKAEEGREAELGGNPVCYEGNEG